MVARLRIIVRSELLEQPFSDFACLRAQAGSCHTGGMDTHRTVPVHTELTGNSGKYISALPPIFFVGEHRTHSRFVKPPAPVNIFFVCSAYLILSIVRLHPRTDSKIEIDRMQRFHCYTSCSPDSDSGGHALIAHQFPRIFHFTRKTSTKSALPTHWTL